MELYEVFAQILSHLVHTIYLQNENYCVYKSIKRQIPKFWEIMFLVLDQNISISWHELQTLRRWEMYVPVPYWNIRENLWYKQLKT